MESSSILDNVDLAGVSGSPVVDPHEPPRKLAVLGLPWETRWALP